MKAKNLLSKIMLASVLVAATCYLTSCGGGRKYLVVPHSVSTESSVSVSDLKLEPGQYEVLSSITETASVICEYKGTEIKVSSSDGSFQYIFELRNDAWILAKFSGAADFGYFTSDYNARVTQIPNAEEFARRVAMARIIRASKDYQADAVIEPVVISNVTNLSKNQIEITSTVTAKLISIKTTR